jgi:hypothetical protein
VITTSGPEALAGVRAVIADEKSFGAGTIERGAVLLGSARSSSTSRLGQKCSLAQPPLLISHRQDLIFGSHPERRTAGSVGKRSREKPDLNRIAFLPAGDADLRRDLAKCRLKAAARFRYERVCTTAALSQAHPQPSIFLVCRAQVKKIHHPSGKD